MILDLILDLLPPPESEESNKMKESKECVTCRDFRKNVFAFPCQVCDPDNNMWSPIIEPIEAKKMKSTSKRIIEVLKEMFTFSDNVNLVAARVTSLIAIPYLCFIAISATGTEIVTSNYTFKGMVSGLLMTIGIWLLGYFSRRPHPDEKPLIIWLKICILKVQIWYKQAYLYFYPDLKKYRGNPKRKAKVWAKRDRLKKLKRELKSLS